MSSREGTPFENRGALGTSIVVSCSICLEVISDDGERTKVKLQCGHEFHLGKEIYFMGLLLRQLGVIEMCFFFFKELYAFSFESLDFFCLM